MQKIKNVLIAMILHTTTIYIAILLFKLIYFNSQIGDGRLAEQNGVAALGSLLILASFSLLLKQKNARRYMEILDILLTLVIFCNIVFYRYFNDLISIPLLFQASVVGDVQSSMVQLLHYSDFLLVIDFIMLPIIGKAVHSKMQKASGKRRNLVNFAACCIAGIMIVSGSFFLLLKNQPTILQTFYDRVYVAKQIGLLNYHAADIMTFAEQNLEDKSELSADKKQEILDYFKNRKQNSEGSKLLYGTAKGKNVIVVQVEALQQFVIDKSINGQEITPNLNKLKKSALYFNNYYYQTAGGGTSDAEFTANISMFPMKEGAVYIRKPGNYYYSLPIKFKENNYSTLAMHGYKPGFWNRSVVYKNIGYDEFYNKTNMKENETLGMGISDKDFFKQAVEQLAKQKQPYYAFLVTLSSHFPYNNDKSKYSSFDVGKYKDTLLGNYLEAVHYTDEALGQFVSELKQKGLLENSVLVIYGDHHAIPKDNENELAEFEGKDKLSSLEWLQLQKVPLIIKTDGIEAETVNTAGGGVDLMPTLLNIMGIDDSNMPFFGHDLMNSKDGFAVLRNGSFVTNDKVYISGENICYDIKTGKQLPIEKYEGLKQEADKLLLYSDSIISFDLVHEIRDYLEK